MKLVEVTDSSGKLLAPEWLARAEPVHRQLRPQLPEGYVDRMLEIFAYGARMLIAVVDEHVVGVAVWRVIENTAEVRRLYVDDLVTHAAERSKGTGKRLLQQLEAQARACGCNTLTLDSGVQRSAAHKFYFREGMDIPSFCFRKSLQ